MDLPRTYILTLDFKQPNFKVLTCNQISNVEDLNLITLLAVLTVLEAIAKISYSVSTFPSMLVFIVLYYRCQMFTVLVM